MKPTRSFWSTWTTPTLKAGDSRQKYCWSECRYGSIFRNKRSCWWLEIRDDRVRTNMALFCWRQSTTFNHHKLQRPRMKLEKFWNNQNASLPAKITECPQTNLPNGAPHGTQDVRYGIAVSRQSNAGHKMDPQLMVPMVLRSLSDTYDTFTSALETRSDNELTMKLVKDKLKDQSLKLSLFYRWQTNQAQEYVGGSLVPSYV